MTSWRIRDFHADDLDGILGLWEEIKASKAEPVYGLSEVLASCQKDHAVVAVHGDQVIGAAVGRAAHAQGWIVFLATTESWQSQGIGTALLRGPSGLPGGARTGALRRRGVPAGGPRHRALPVGHRRHPHDGLRPGRRGVPRGHRAARPALSRRATLAARREFG